MREPINNEINTGNQKAVKKLFIDALCAMGKSELVEDFKKSFATRGKHKGFIKGKPSNGIQKAIIQGLQANSNPFKIGLLTIAMLRGEELEAFEIIKGIGDTINKCASGNIVACLDADRVALESVGAW